MATEVLKDTYEKNKTEQPINTTTGFHTAKHTPEEWIQHNYAKYYQSFTDRENADRNQHESQKLAHETHDLMKRLVELAEVHKTIIFFQYFQSHIIEFCY